VLKIRGKKHVITEIVRENGKYMQKMVLEYSGKCFISNSACYDDARKVADLVEENFS
jgi:hypothetical protein